MRREMIGGVFFRRHFSEHEERLSFYVNHVVFVDGVFSRIRDLTDADVMQIVDVYADYQTVESSVSRAGKYRTKDASNSSVTPVTAHSRLKIQIQKYAPERGGNN